MALDINNINTRIERLKTEIARADGQKQSVEEQLARDYSVDTIEDAEALLDKIAMELQESEKAQEEYIEAADKLLREAGL
jgi:hypothetical protein